MPMFDLLSALATADPVELRPTPGPSPTLRRPSRLARRRKSRSPTAASTPQPEPPTAPTTADDRRNGLANRQARVAGDRRPASKWTVSGLCGEPEHEARAAVGPSGGDDGSLHPAALRRRRAAHTKNW